MTEHGQRPRCESSVMSLEKQRFYIPGKEKAENVSVAGEEGREQARVHETDALYTILKNLEFTLSASRNDEKMMNGVAFSHIILKWYGE